MDTVRCAAGLLAGVASAALATAALAFPQPSPGRSLGDLAACAHDSDPALCLLKLAALDRMTPLSDVVALAYVPGLVEQVDNRSPPQPKLKATAAFLTANEHAAVAALRLDAAGASPAESLAAIQKSNTPVLPEWTQDVRQGDARSRLRIYKMILDVAADPIRPQANHRPSQALVRAVLTAGCADLAASRDRSAPEAFVRAQMRIGDEAGARACLDHIRLSPADWRLAPALLAVGLHDKAAAALSTRIRGPGFDDDSDRALLAGIRVKSMWELARAGRQDLALHMADEEIQQAIAAPDPVRPAKVGALQLSAIPNVFGPIGAVQLVSRYASKDDTMRTLERIDAAARGAGPAKVVSLAAAAFVGWSEAGRPDRSAELRQALSKRQEGCDERRDCVATSPYELLLLAGAPFLSGEPSAPVFADSSAPAFAESAFESDMRAGLRERLDARLKSIPGEQRPRTLNTCASEAASDHLALAAYCAELAASDLNGLWGEPALAVSDAVHVAASAAATGDMGTVRRMLDMAFKAAALAPGREAMASHAELETIATALLREQGRL